MGSLSKYISPVVLITGAVISTWFFICNLQTFQPAPYAFVVCAIIGLYLLAKVFNRSLITVAKEYVLNVTRRKYFVVTALLVITVVGLLARLFFTYRFSYVPTSDPMTFYDSGMTLAGGGSLQGNVYIALFPYLAAYNNVLSLAMRLIPDPWIATILLNTLFDILSSLAIYVLLKKLLKPGSKLPVIAFGVWMLNPLNIIFSVMSLPVIAVNFFVILTILVSYLLIQQITSFKTKNALLLATILGFTLGFGNCFRPIFIVAIIALVILCILMFLASNRSIKFLKLFIGCIFLSLVLFIGIQKLNVAFVSNQIDLHAAESPAGWSMYVGSSWETFGEWRPYHNDQMSAICRESLSQGNYDECHAELQSLAITNYKNYGLLKSANLFIRKLYHQAGQQNYFYNAEQSLVGYSASRTSKFVNTYMVVYMIALFILSAKFLYELAKQAASGGVVNPIFIFITLIVIGWFFSFMFVESAPRYSTILYPIFIIFSVLALDKYTGKSATR